MSVGRYQSYRESGAEWLGEVPSHWGVNRLKASVAASKGGIWGEDADGGLDDIICLRVADFDRNSLTVSLENPTVRKIPDKDRRGRLLRRGDLLLEKSGGGEKQPVGAVVLYDHAEEAVCSNFIARLELSKSQHPAFWRYVHAAAYARGLSARSLNQTSGIQNLDQTRYLDERAPFPPFVEQIDIAAFLDRETGKIDALVEAQRRLIELLKEKRQTVISHAVTKGLDPNVPMKNSGIEWLGEVPAHWEVVKLSRFVSARRPITYGIVQAGPHVEDGVPYIRPADMSDEEGVLDAGALLRTSPEIAEAYRRSRIQTGDLICSIGPSFGKLMIVPPALEGANLTQGTARVAVAEPSSVRFAFWALRSASANAQWEASIGGATFRALNLEPLARTILARPPWAEQVAIAEFLDREIDRLDRLASEAREGISLLLERRAALISAAVTGKIDVRGLVPEQAEAA